MDMAQISELLSPQYVPEKLIAREAQLAALSANGMVVKNFYIEGSTNTGKTATVLRSAELLRQRQGHFPIYVRCERSIMVPFRFAVEQNIGHPLRFRHNAIYEFFKEAKILNVEHLHVFMDDAHQVAQYEKTGSVKWTEVIHQLYEAARTFHRKLQMVIVGTTPYLDYGAFVSKLHKDDKARANLQPLIFDAYKPGELKEIYGGRLELAGVDFQPETVDWVVETVRQNAGELPMGFEMLLAGVERMNEQHSRMLQREHVETAFKSVKIDYWSQKVEEMDKQTRMIFLTTTILADEQITSPNAIELNGHQISERYERLCRENRMEPLYAQRRNYILQKLCTQGFLGKIGVDPATFSNRYKYELNPKTMRETMEKMGLIKFKNIT